jgi:hypothetical protein
MAIADDFSVAANGDVRYTGTTTNYTVLELHRFLQDLADQATGSGDDLLDITDSNPSSRSTDNIITLNSPYNIDDTAAQHLYDGSITQGGGDTFYRGLEVVGSVNSGSTQLQIVQNNALLTNYWGTGLNADAGNNILLRILVKTRSAGTTIDSERIRVQARELGDSFDEFSVTMGAGVNVAAISTVADLNNQTVAGTIALWTSITNIEGYQTIDLGDGSGPQPYYSQWNIGTQTINDTYERTKWITRRGTSETIHGINGELFRGITHQWNYDTEATGPFQEDEVLSWGTGATAGTGLLLALLDSGATGTMWIQLLTGVPPTDNETVTGGTSSATCLVNGSVTSRTVSKSAFVGSSTGTAIIGAFGIGFEAADVGASDSLTDLENDVNSPPNNVTFSVNSLVSGEDRILVGPEDGAGGLDLDQLSLNGTLSGAAVTSVVVSTTIPSDTPATGTIRVANDNGNFILCTYSSYTGSTFTIAATDFSTVNATTGNNVFISYIDKVATASTESFTSVYSVDRDLFIRVRDGGGTPIVPFETTGTLGTAGGSVNAIRQADV